MTNGRNTVRASWEAGTVTAPKSRSGIDKFPLNFLDELSQFEFRNLTVATVIFNYKNGDCDKLPEIKGDVTTDSIGDIFPDDIIQRTQNSSVVLKQNSTKTSSVKPSNIDQSLKTIFLWIFNAHFNHCRSWLSIECIYISICLLSSPIVVCALPFRRCSLPETKCILKGECTLFGDHSRLPPAVHDRTWHSRSLANRSVVSAFYTTLRSSFIMSNIRATKSGFAAEAQAKVIVKIWLKLFN